MGATNVKECVAVLTMLYKKNGAVSCVGSGFLSDWALYLARTWLPNEQKNMQEIS